MSTEILKVLVGSRANGLWTEESDYDYRTVFVEPTKELLRLHGAPQRTMWTEGEKDCTGHEILTFMDLACHCNPSVLEVFVAPIVEATQEGQNLRSLLPNFLDKDRILNSFLGYSKNQQKKFLDSAATSGQVFVGTISRRWKFAVAYIRSLINALTLLRTGTFSLQISDAYIGDLRRIRDGERSMGSVIEWAEYLKDKVEHAHRHSELPPQNLEPVSEFLLAVRKEHWNEC